MIATVNISAPVTVGVPPLPPPPDIIPNRTLREKILLVVKGIFRVISYTALALLNPIPFAISFFGGVAFSSKAGRVVERISNGWKEKAWYTKIGIVAFLFLFAPISLAAGSVYAGLDIGSRLNKPDPKKKLIIIP